MKLKPFDQPLDVKLLEFDTWITAALSEIKDSKQFAHARLLISQVIERIGSFTHNFDDTLTPDTISESILTFVNSQDCINKDEALGSFLNLMFLVTGKSDNNAKCQFPVYLSERHRTEGFPLIKALKGKKSVAIGPIPRTIDSERFAGLVLRLEFDGSLQHSLFNKYISFVLNDESYWKSFQAIGLGYFRAKAINYHLEFLLPLVVFQVRGSLSASGGHEPENRLRLLMRQWGLEAGVDFNIADHIIQNESVVEEPPIEGIAKEKEKTRAYDFVLPLWEHNDLRKILIQCQFYAGDSGSVSHKNIDQTRASRNGTKTQNPNFLFVEYVDGAGYYSSLNGDLKKLLSMPDTHDFFQFRTAAIKLRRVIQQIGVLTPLELTHAIAKANNGLVSEVVKVLLGEGYSEQQVNHAIAKAASLDFVKIKADTIAISEGYKQLSRIYYLLDALANHGEEFNPSEIITGALFVPGYSARYGLRLAQLVDKITLNAGLFAEDWKNAKTLFDDIQFLADKRWLIQS
jgi:hypothetical protein